MNWFTKLFFPRNTSPPQKKKPEISFIQPDDPLACSLPVFIEHENIPLTTLKKLVPLREMDNATVEKLTYTTLGYASGSVIVRRGQKTNSVFYLLKGSVELWPDSNNSYILLAESSRAHLPLNSGKLCGVTVIADKDSTILAISSDFIGQWSVKDIQQPSVSAEFVDLGMHKQTAGNHFFTSFSKAYRENKVTLPSLPNVALKLKKALEQDLGINDVVKIIAIDASIVAKLIQLANSPLYSPIQPITNCHEAVLRLGLDQTQKLVMGINLKQLFNCNNPELMKRMQALWKNSLYVSSLSFVLAQENGTVDPEDALLGGLISDIGAIPLLQFAEQNPNEYLNMEALDAAIPVLSPMVGSMVLKTLGFSPELASIPKYAECWFYDSESDGLTLTDIVILAKLHSYFGTARAKELPFIYSIPAYNKLKNNKLTPDFSLDALHKAKHRVNLAMNFLS